MANNSNILGGNKALTPFDSDPFGDKKKVQQPIYTPAKPQGNASILTLEQELYTIAYEMFTRRMLKKGIVTVEQAVLIMMRGRELDLPPMLALELMYIVDGRILVEGQGLLSMIQRKHGGDAIIPVQTDNDIAIVKYKRREWEEYAVSQFTMDDANRAGLLGKLNWIQHPRNMLFWKAVTNAAKFGFADVITGLYIAEELG